MARVLTLGLLLWASIAHADGIELPVAWTHSYVDPADSLVMTTVTFGSPADSCVVRDDEGLCLSMVTGMVSSAWSEPDPYQSFFSLDPVTGLVWLHGWERDGFGGFYVPPIPWIPAFADRSDGFQWSWSGELHADGSEPVAASLDATLEVVDEVLVVPYRPGGTNTLRISYDGSIDVDPGAKPTNLMGAARRAVITRWWGTVNQRVCVLMAEDGWHLTDIQLQGSPVPTRATSFGRLRAGYE